MKFTTIYSTLGRVVLAIIALCFLPSIEAQSNNTFGVCLAGWEWSYNSEGQNPCEIGGALQAPCLGYFVYVLGPLAQPGTNYITPQADDAVGKKCGCNTVIYSLYIACSLCQWPPGSVSNSWAFWAQFCDSVYVGQYPFPIPQNTSVPHWAYLNDTAGSGFNPTLAEAAGRDPEATPTSPPSPPSPTNSTIPSVGGGHKTNNVGAIAGGVVGGVLGLAGLATFILLILRRLTRRRNQRAAANNILAPNPLENNPNMVELTFEPPKLYDPSDPSTFPTFVPDGDSPPRGGYPANPYQSGRYRGAPEL